MKVFGKSRLLSLLALAALSAFFLKLTPSWGDTSDAKPTTPLTEYRLISDRAFDPFADDSEDGSIVTVDEIVQPTPLNPRSLEPSPSDVLSPELTSAESSSAELISQPPEIPAAYGAEDLFPTYVQPNTPKSAPARIRNPEPTVVMVEENVAMEPEAVAKPLLGPESRDATPEGIARSEKVLAFPLTLNIPGYDPESMIVTEIDPVVSSGQSSPPSAYYPLEPEPIASILQISSPSVVGVGATLGDSASDIYLDALVPFWQSRSDYMHTIAFLVPRIATTEDEMNTGSLGLGIRSLHGEGSFMGGDFPWIIGANVFYDFTHSTNDFNYNQFGAGIEWMSPFLDLRLNGYLPESTKNKVDETSSSSTSIRSSTSSDTTYGSLYPSDHNVYQPYTTTSTTVFQRTTTTRFFEQFERALTGFDGEAGFLVPDTYTLFPIRIYGGFYSFDNPYGDDITGPKARVEARPFTFLLLDASWYQDEELLGSTWFLGARASVSIGGGPVPPASSKPLHDTSLGPKTEAYNPYASFQSRLVERIPRNYQAILTTSPFLENLDRQQVSVSRSSTSTTETGQITVASRLIFVDSSRGTVGGAGTWQSPQNTIQSGANLAIANLGSSGQIWTVWTQGEVGTYTENITVTDSVRFISSSIPITGNGGRTFVGSGEGPVVDGGFLFGSLPAGPASPTIPVGTVQGYEITGGHTAASFAGITFVNVELADASLNQIDTIGGTGIEVVNTGTNSATGTFDSNEIFNTGGEAMHFDLSDSSQSSYRVSNSSFQNLTDNGVRIDASDSATYDMTIAQSGASGLSNAAVALNATDDSSGSLTVSNSAFDGAGIDTSLSANAEGSLTVSGVLFENDPNSALTLAASDNAQLLSDVQNNILRDNQSALSLEVTGTAVSDTTFSGNSINNSGASAAVAVYEGTGTQTLTVSGNQVSATDGDAIVAQSLGGTVNATVSNNSIDTATNRGIVLSSSLTGTMNATVSGNGTSSTSGGGIIIRSSDSSGMSVTASNNVVENSGTYGIRLQAANTSNNNVILSGNTIRETVSAAVDILAADNSILAALIQANAITDSTTSGVQADASDQGLLSLTASNNNITNTTQEGILVTGSDNSSSRFEARSNLIASIGNASGIRASFLDNHDSEIIIATNLIGPTARRGIEVETSDATTSDFTLQGNRVYDSSQDAIRMTLFSTEDQTVAIYNNDLQRTGAHGVNLATQGAKQVSIYNNEIGTTGGAAVRGDMQSGGLVLNGANLGNNLYTDLTPVPFDAVGTAPYTGGAGIRINGVIYP